MNPMPTIMRSLKNLPAFPTVALKALDLLNKPEVSIQELVEVVQFDPSVTANVLRISNSAYFGLRREIHSLNQALLYLGTQQLLKIIIASGATRVMSRRTPVYFPESQGLWRHSISCALMVSLLSRELSLGDETISFTAGLLHDIGKVALCVHVEQQFQQIMSKVEQDGLSFQEAEKAVLGLDHAELGGEMARMWDFPDRLRLVITCHHLDRPESFADDLVLLVYLADLLVLMFGQDMGADGLAYQGHPEVLRHFHLRERDLQRIFLKFGGLRQQAWDFFANLG